MLLSGGRSAGIGYRRPCPTSFYSRLSPSVAQKSFSNNRERDPQQMKADHEHCVELVQQRDREGYLCGLLMPRESRKSYFSVRAFNVELASIKDGSERRQAKAVTTQEVGSSLALRMRMQWWRDALDEIYPEDDNVVSKHEGPSPAGFLASSSSSCWNNPVVRALNDAVAKSNLTRRFLVRLLDAREADLDIQQMATLDDAKQYAEDTYASLLYLALECADIRDDAADTCAHHAGVGLGLTIALRSTAHRALSGEMSIPADLFSRPIPSSYLIGRHDSEFEVIDEHEEALKEAVQYLAYEASQQLAKAREQQNDIPSAGKACLLPVVPAIHYLSLLRQEDYDLWETTRAVDASRLIVMARLAKSWLSGRI